MEYHHNLPSLNLRLANLIMKLEWKTHIGLIMRSILWSVKEKNQSVCCLMSLTLCHQVTTDTDECLPDMKPVWLLWWICYPVFFDKSIVEWCDPSCSEILSISLYTLPHCSKASWAWEGGDNWGQELKSVSWDLPFMIRHLLWQHFKYRIERDKWGFLNNKIEISDAQRLQMWLIRSWWW